MVEDKGYMRQDVKMAGEAQHIKEPIMNPTDREFAGMVREKLLTNCPVTVCNIDTAIQIFGPDLANLRGKTTRSNLEHV